MNNITHNRSENFFELLRDGHRCVLNYTLTHQVMTITHTGVPAELGGLGLAAELTRFALDFARTERMKVVPQCSYVSAYIKRHPEYALLVANS